MADYVLAVRPAHFIPVAVTHSVSKYAIALSSIAVLALLLRVTGQLGNVFTSQGVMFHDPDSYYYLWLSDKLLAGQAVAYSPLAYMVVGIARLFGGSQQAMEIAAAWYAPVTGALLVIPVYFLGVAVFDSKFVGILGALLVSVLPSAFYNRSLLGYYDHHALEVLLTTIILLCATQLLKGKRPLWLAGGLTALGLYFALWSGAGVLVAVMLAYASILAAISLLKRKPASADRFAVVAVVILGTLLIYRDQITNTLNSSALFFTPSSTRQVISEARAAPPLILMINFGFLFLPLAVGGMISHRINRATGLFLLWSAGMVIAMFMQARWGYYAAVPVVLYSAWVIQYIARKTKPAVGVVLIIFPLLISAPFIYRVATLPVEITPGWHTAAQWLRDNTPTPKVVAMPVLTPKPEYTVLSWWDYGYWIRRIGDRVPIVDSGTQSSIPEASRFFTATDEQSAKNVITGLGIRYIIIDRAMVTGKYWAMAMDAGKTPDSLHESAGYHLYYDGEYAGFKLVEDFGEVKIFGPVD